LSIVFASWDSHGEYRTITVLDTFRPNELARVREFPNSASSPTCMLCIQPDVKWAPEPRPMLLTEDLTPTAVRGASLIQLKDGRRQLAVLDFTSAACYVGALKTLIVGIDWDFSLVCVFSSRQISKEDLIWEVQSTTPWRQTLEQPEGFRSYLRADWLLPHERSHDRFAVTVPKNAFRLAGIITGSPSLTIQSLCDEQLAVKVEQRTRLPKVSFQLHSSTETANDLSRDGLYVKIEPGYPTYITLAKRRLPW
jgi:hypothetical protein